MSYPLFAGWGDAEKFSSLVEKDVARLQRRIAELRSNAASALRGTGSRNGGGDASTASMGRRELVDPAACTRSLAAMLLGTDALAQGSHFAGGPRAESPQRREHQWRTLCNELAKRAAHLEVLLAMLAEAMVVHLVGSGASYSKASAALADAAGCPSTRIGWVDEAFAALTPVTTEARTASETHSIGVLAKLRAPGRSLGVTATLQAPVRSVGVDAGTPLALTKRVAVQAARAPADRNIAVQTEAKLPDAIVASATVACQTEADLWLANRLPTIGQDPATRVHRHHVPSTADDEDEGAATRSQKGAASPRPSAERLLAVPTPAQQHLVSAREDRQSTPTESDCTRFARPKRKFESVRLSV